MSKSLNLVLSLLSGTAIVLAGAFVVANWNYGQSKIDILEDRLGDMEVHAQSSNLEIVAKTARANELEEKVKAVQAKALALASTGTFSEPAPDSDGIFGLGRSAIAEEILAWDVNVLPDGRGLPKGRGDVMWGEEVFAEKCASCHGDFAEGVDNWPVLADGFDTLADEDPVKTVGSYWPHLSTAWDYIHRSMPFGAAGTLTVDETYATVAYILYSNYLVDDDFELSHENFSDFEMYNKDGFIIDDRSKTEYSMWRIKPCMENCKSDVKITMRASVLDVTPDEEVVENSLEIIENSSLSSPTILTTDTDRIDPILVAKGEKVFKKCTTCHQVGDGAKNRTGPHLNAVVGRQMGNVDGFKYSKSLLAAAQDGAIWSVENLDPYLENPKKFMPKTKMSFSGLRKADDRKSVIAYLAQFSEPEKTQKLSTENTIDVTETSSSLGFTVSSDILSLQGDSEYGEYLASECLTCHQLSGSGDGIPIIHGLSKNQFVTALHAYRAKYRDNSVMQLVAGRLTDQEIAALAAYFEELEIKK